MRKRREEHLTASQRAALETELHELEGPRRTKVVAAIRTAREHGDLSENFEYHAAKNEQGLLEARIRTLRDRLDHAVVIDESELATDVVAVGSVVEIEDEGGERVELDVSSVGGAGTVSPASPLGSALLGATVGDVVEVAAPQGAWKARVVSVRRA
jgi:transcription elongation factor GreA